MPRRSDDPGARRVAALMLPLAILLAACGSSAAPSPTPAGVVATPAAAAAAKPPSVATARPATEPTATPTPKATPKPKPGRASSKDPARDLSIAKPYRLTLVDPDLAGLLDSTFERTLGSMTKVIHTGYREVLKGGASQGFVLVITMPGVPGVNSPAFLTQLTKGVTAGRKSTKATIGGEPVRLYTDPRTKVSYALYAVHDGAVAVWSESAKKAKAVTRALIKG